MRGRLSDQDLTDYALNEQEPHERLYVESMLAVSEECRADVYDLIEVGQMIEEGFERDEMNDEDLILTPMQRSRLLTVRRNPFAVARKAAAVLAAAACAAFALVHPSFLPNRGTAVRVAHVSREVAQVVTHAVTPVRTGGVAASLDSVRAFMDEPAKWIPDTATATVTPPQWLDIDAEPGISVKSMPIAMPVGMPDFSGVPY